MTRLAKHSGFSLLEVLVALAIMGMVGLLMSALFSTTSQVWSRATKLDQIMIPAANRHLLISQLELIPVVTFNRGLSGIFRDEKRAFFFLGTENQDEWEKVSFENQTLTWTRANQVRLVVVSDITTASFKYFGRKSVAEKPDWHSDWYGAVLLPKLILIETVRSDGTPNPPLAIQPAKTTRQSEISLSSLVPPT